jgi:hypothetical protein
MAGEDRMLTTGRVLLCLSVVALIGTIAMPPVHEAVAQMQWKKKQKQWAAKKNCPLQFTPGGRRPTRACG